MKACKDDDRVTVERLLKKGVYVNSTDEEGKTALMYACDKGHFEVVKFLLDQNLIMNRTEETNGAISLISIHARYKTSLDIATHAIEDHDSTKVVNIQDDTGWAVMRKVSYKGHLDIAKQQIDRNIQVDYRDVNGWTALMYASDKGHVEIIKLLIDKGSSLNTTTRDAMTPLMIASKNGHIDVVRLLLDKGAQVDIQTNQRLTAYTIAKQNGHVDIAKMLLDRGANKAFIVEV